LAVAQGEARQDHKAHARDLLDTCRWDFRDGWDYRYVRHLIASTREPIAVKGNVKLLGVAFSPDSAAIATASIDGMVRVWAAATGKQTASFPKHAGHVRSVAFSLDGKRLASAGGD